MGKKKQKMRGQRGDPNDSDDDTASIGSVASDVSDASITSTMFEFNFVDVSSKLDAYIDDLISKRSPARNKAMSSLTSALRKRCMTEFIGTRSETLQFYICNMIKKASKTQEVVDACELLSVVAITLGSDDRTELALKKSWPILETFIKDPAKKQEARAACISALGVLTFTANADYKETVEPCMQLAKWLFHKKSGANMEHSELLTQSLETYSLLSTIIPDSKLVQQMNEVVPILMSLLENSSVDVRAAAGENLALFFAGEANMEEPVYDSKGSTDMTFNAEALIEKLEELATDSSKRRSKKERAKGRSTFRDILNTVETGEPPVESLKVSRIKVELEGWVQLRQFATMKKYLNLGLTQHFKTNELLQHIFECTFEEEYDEEGENIKGSKLEMIAKYQNKARENFEKRGKARKNKNAFANQGFDDY